MELAKFEGSLLDSNAEEQRVGLQQKLQSNNFFSIVVDGTTDSSVSDAEVIYIRYTSTLLALENSFTGLGSL